MGHNRPKSARRLAKLLPNQSQFELRAALAADVLGVVDAVEPALFYSAAQPVEGRRG
jgi:hypothetical protein